MREVKDRSPSFTSQSNTGSGRGEVVPAGGTFGGFTITNSAPGRLGTTAQLLDGNRRQPEQGRRWRAA